MSNFLSFFTKKPIEQSKTETQLIAPFVQHYSKIELPTFKENEANGWTQYGSDNQFPSFLLELAEQSAIHNGIINGKSYLIAGGDFIVNNLPLEEWKKTASINEAVEVQSLINNAYGEPWHDLKAKFALDWTISGAFAMIVNWSMNFSRIVSVEYVPWQNVRAGIPINGRVERYFVAENWKGRQIEATEYQAFSINSHLPDGILPDEFESISDYPYSHQQLLYVRNHFPGWKVYGRPSYIGALTSIKSSSMLSQFYQSSIENGFSPSMIISYNQQPSSEEQGNSIRKSLEKQFTNKGVGRKLAVFFSPNRDAAPNFVPLDVKNLDTQMLQLQNALNSDIITGHSVTSPELVGVSVPGQLGTGDFEAKWNLFNKTVIQKDKAIIERVISLIAGINGIQSTIKIEDKSL